MLPLVRKRGSNLDEKASAYKSREDSWCDKIREIVNGGGGRMLCKAKERERVFQENDESFKELERYGEWDGKTYAGFERQ